jgi:hypothetical protein
MQPFGRQGAKGLRRPITPESFHWLSRMCRQRPASTASDRYPILDSERQQNFSSGREKNSDD